MDAEDALYTANRFAHFSVLRCTHSPLMAYRYSLAVLLVLDGRVRAKRANQRFELEKGDWTFINCGELFAFWTENAAAPAGGASVLLAELNLPALAEIYPGIDRLIFCNCNYAKQEGPKREVDAVRRISFAKYLVESAASAGVSGTGGASMDKAAAGAAAVRIKGGSTRTEGHSVAPALDRLISLAVSEYNFLYYVRNARDYLSPEKIERVYRTIWKVRYSFADTISLESIAGAEGVSSIYFTDLWKDMLSMPFMRWVNRGRSIASEADLLSGEHRLIDIAADYGFSDVKYYNKTFAGHFGMRPAEWRAFWKAYAAEKSDMISLSPEESRIVLDEFSLWRFKGMPAGAADDNTRMYSQYCTLRGLRNQKAELKELAVSVDFFAPENLRAEKGRAPEWPEWKSIELVVQEVIRSGIGLELRVKTAFLSVDVYREGFEGFVLKSIQYRGIRDIRDWKFVLVCANAADIEFAHGYSKRLKMLLKGGSVEIVLE